MMRRQSAFELQAKFYCTDEDGNGEVDDDDDDDRMQMRLGGQATLIEMRMIFGDGD